MGNLEQLFTTNFDIWEMVKWLYALAFLVASIFAFVVQRQVQLMSRTLEGSFNPIIHLMGWSLVLVAATGLVATVLVL